MTNELPVEISANVCKKTKGRGRPKKLTVEMERHLQQFFPNCTSYRSRVRTHHASIVYRGLAAAIGEDGMAGGQQQLARWPWLLRPHREQWTVLAALHAFVEVEGDPAAMVENLVFMADTLEEFHRNHGTNARKALAFVRMVIRDTKRHS